MVAKVDAQCSALAAELEAFNAKFEAERADRQKREAALIAAQSELEQRLTEQIDQERAARERQVMQLRTELDAEIARRTKADERFQTAMAEELAAVRNVRVLVPRCCALLGPVTLCAPGLCAVATTATITTFLSLHFCACESQSLRAEVAVRAKEDEELLHAITAYAQKLQASLQIVNASDTELRRL